MKSKQTVFIVSIVAAIVIIVGLGVVLSKPAAPSKYDAFAQALDTSGAKFYGAFWCPHCQAEKALFGSSKKYLPYVECSNPDQSVTAICKENKIESYPTWFFKDGIKITSKEKPEVCSVKPGLAGEAEVCKQIASAYYKTYIFPGYSFSIRGAAEPVHTGDQWSFVPGSSVTGEVPLNFLAAQIGFTLPL